MSDRQPYLKALRFGWLTRFYDRLAPLLKEDKLKGRLIAQARIEPGHRVLDVGCGTATLTLMAQAQSPAASVFGVDGDLETLVLARRKALAAGVPSRFCAALAQELPFPESTFERAVSSLFFHHLTRSSRREVLGAIRDTLSPAGELHVLDWGRAQDPLMRLLFVLVQLFDGFATTADSVRGRLPRQIREVGYAEVEETHRERTILGTLALYRARERRDNRIRHLHSSSGKEPAADG